MCVHVCKCVYLHVERVCVSTAGKAENKIAEVSECLFYARSFISLIPCNKPWRLVLVLLHMRKLRLGRTR